MSNYKNKEALKYILLSIVIGIIGIILYIGLISYQSNLYRKSGADYITKLMVSITDKYPEVTGEELVMLLNTAGEEKDNNSEIDTLLKRYGINETSFYIKAQEGSKYSFIITGVAIMVMFLGLFLLCFVLYINKRKSELLKLEKYIDRMSSGEYELDLMNNSEDELSNLKNHLYKLMVYLKEQADNASTKKVLLAESVSDISHQLKTPLTSTQILLDNLNDNPDMDKDVRKKFIYEALNQVNGMSWLIISLLKLSRIDTGVVEFHNEEVSLNKLIEEAIENLEVIAEIKGVFINFIGSDMDITIKGDYNWNREALQNIIKNALEHSNSGTSVDIRLENNDVYKAVYISNIGKTLTKQEQRSIFERYYSKANFNDNSMGLGLPLAKAVIERQGGYIAVDSQDNRTTFTVKYLTVLN